MADPNFNASEFEDLIDWDAYGAPNDFQQGQIGLHTYGSGDVNTGIGQPSQGSWQDGDDTAFNDWLASLNQPSASSGSGTAMPAELPTTNAAEQRTLSALGGFQPPGCYSQGPTLSPQGNLLSNVSTTSFRQYNQHWDSGADNGQDLAQTLDPQLLSNLAFDQTAATPTALSHYTTLQTPRPTPSIRNTGLPARQPPTTAARFPSNADETRPARLILNTGLPTGPPATTAANPRDHVFRTPHPTLSILNTGIPTRPCGTAVNNPQTHPQTPYFPTPTSTNHAQPSNRRDPETDTPSKQRPKKTHPCTWEGCGRTFAGPHNVKQHVREAHTGERPYKCPECYQVGVEKAFARPGSLNRHRKDLHGMSAGPGRGNVKRSEGREVSVQIGVSMVGGNGGGEVTRVCGGGQRQAHSSSRGAILNGAATPQTPSRYSGATASAPWRGEEALFDRSAIADANSTPATAFELVDLEPGQVVHNTIEPPDFGSPLSQLDDFEQVADALRRRHEAAHNRSSVPDASSISPTTSTRDDRVSVPTNEDPTTSDATYQEHAEDEVVYLGMSDVPINGFRCFNCFHIADTQRDILAHMHTKHNSSFSRLCSCGACSLLNPCAEDAGTKHAELLGQIAITPPAVGSETVAEEGKDANVTGLGRAGLGGGRPSDVSFRQA